MEGFDGDKLGQAIAVLIAVGGIIGAIIRGLVKGDGKAPEERAPNIHEVKQFISDLMEALERMDDANSDRFQKIIMDLSHIKRDLDDARQDRRIDDAFRRRDSK